MDCLLIYPKNYLSSNVIMSGNPNKKMRLDFQKKCDINTGNDDLWGQDDLTAEEFDMLEIQATQSFNQTVTYQNNKVQDGSKQEICLHLEDLKQLQYELEGRVKLLSQSLERSTKELSEERLNREKIIKERMKEFSDRENNLQKEVEKMQSILEFKEQEMKSTSNKLEILKSVLQDKKNTSEVPTNFEDFFKSSKCGLNNLKCDRTQKYSREHKLSIDTPKGKMKDIEILSSILCDRLCSPPTQTFDCRKSVTLSEGSSVNFGFTPVSIVHLKTEQKSDELLEYYCCLLKNHVTLLKTLQLKTNGNFSKISPVSSRWKEAGYSHTVISCLRNIPNVFSCSSLNNIPFVKEACGQSSVFDSVMHEEKTNASNHIFSMLLESLLVLCNPDSYPNGYSKTEEIECSLSALLTICLSCPEKFLNFIDELPVYSFLKPHESTTSFCTTLKLITALCCCKNFAPYLMHKNRNCLFCLIDASLISVLLHPGKFDVCVILIEDFLTSVFSVHKISETQLQEAECISKVIQNIIKCLWMYCQGREKITLSIELIKKGLTLLHLMSCSIQNFKERRSPVEDEYVSLISGILAISKDMFELRGINDVIHSLWDFQTDVSEFDAEESAEETQTPTSENDLE